MNKDMFRGIVVGIMIIILLVTVRMIINVLVQRNIAVFNDRIAVVEKVAVTLNNRLSTVERAHNELVGVVRESVFKKKKR